jgi:hypothetical protein
MSMIRLPRHNRSESRVGGWTFGASLLLFIGRWALSVEGCALGV